jgi:hypothetical protein
MAMRHRVVTCTVSWYTNEPGYSRMILQLKVDAAFVPAWRHRRANLPRAPHFNSFSRSTHYRVLFSNLLFVGVQPRELGGRKRDGHGLSKWFLCGAEAFVFLGGRGLTLFNGLSTPALYKKNIHNLERSCQWIERESLLDITLRQVGNRFYFNCLDVFAISTSTPSL